MLIGLCVTKANDLVDFMIRFLIEDAVVEIVKVSDCRAVRCQQAINFIKIFERMDYSLVSKGSLSK